MYFLIKLFLFTLIFENSFCFLDSRFIAQYLKFKNVQQGSVYTCYEKKDQIEFARTVMTQNLSLSIFNLRLPDLNINTTNIYVKNNPHFGIVVDGDCQYVEEFLIQSGVCEVFTDVHHWLVIMKNRTAEDIFQNVSMTISTDLKVAIPEYQDNSQIKWNLLDVYNQAFAHNGDLKIDQYGTYTDLAGFNISRPRENLYWRRRNMTGVIFRSMVVLPKQYPGKLEDYLFSDKNREINSFNRFHAVLIYYMKDFYNYSLNMSVTKSWGYKLPNGSFDGLVRALEYKLVDFGASPLFVKNERWPVVDYGRRTWLLRSVFIFRIPKRPASFQVFLRPLDGDVWYVTVLAIIVIVVVFKIALKSEYFFMHDVLNSFESTWSFLLLFTVGAICQQGSAETPNKIGSRTCFIFVFIFTVLLYQFYSASIVSILLMTPARFINNLRDLAFSQLKMGCEDVLYNKDYIAKLQYDPIINRLEHKGINKNNVSFYCDPEVGLPLVAKGGYAFHVEVATAYPIIEKTFDEDTICSLDEIQMFQTQQMHQPLQKHSPFREMLNFVLQRIDESGLMKRQLKYWHARKPECIRSRPPTSSVSIDEFYPALSVLLIGMIISLIFLVFEFMVKIRLEKLENRRIRKKIRPFRSEFLQ